MSNPYPLILEPILKPKVWGGRRLAEYGKHLPADEPTGESWELADLASTSTSGGGGDSAHSTITNGELAGKTIRDAMQQWGTELLGDSNPTETGGFPLLVKYLDAREHLSIQVHPSPEYASSHPDAHLKTESWFILDAQPDADGNPPVIYKGFQDGVTADDLKAAIQNGTVPDIMRTELAVPGHCHTLPSGTVHALGAGVLVAEIQTPSDTTFRVYDWAKEYGREGRELHIDQAVECASFEHPPVAEHAEAFLADDMANMSAMPPRIGSTRHRVASTEHYTIDIISASCESVPLVAPDDDRNTPIVVMLLKTMGASIATENAEHQLQPGQTVLIPAAIAKDCSLRAGPGTEAVVARVV
ncbi:MAG: type I phosphomannose isomerase catalytic subunit [Phycisphaerales bacterium JB052]